MWQPNTEAIKEIREALGITQEEFGKRIGISAQAICQWEADSKKPGVDNIVKIANAFGASPLRFFREVK